MVLASMYGSSASKEYPSAGNLWGPEADCAKVRNGAAAMAKAKAPADLSA